MKRTFLYLVIILTAIAHTGCIEYKEVKVVDVTGIGIKDISVKGIKIEVSMQIKNPNKYAISIVDSDLDIYLKGNKMGKAKLQEKITLPKKSNKIHRFTIQSSLKEVSSGILPLMMSIISNKAVDLQIKGDIKARAKGISKKFPVDFKENVKL